MQQIYLCRHGETAWTLSGQHTGKTDIPLTERGQRQAALLRKRLQPVQFEKVFSSPRIRALQSSEGLDPVIDSRIAEWDYGDYEGLTSKRIHEQSPHWRLFKEGAPNGESIEQISQRADQFLQMIHQYKGKVAVFSHGHFLRILCARYLGLRPEMGKLFSLSVASLGILGHEKGEPALILWNDVSHLASLE